MDEGVSLLAYDPIIIATVGPLRSLALLLLILFLPSPSRGEGCFPDNTRAQNLLHFPLGGLIRPGLGKQAMFGGLAPRKFHMVFLCIGMLDECL